MDLIVNQVVELQVIHDTHSNGVIKGLTGTPVLQNGLTVEEAEGIRRAEG